MKSPWVTFSHVSVIAKKSRPEEEIRSGMMAFLLSTEQALSKPSLGRETSGSEDRWISFSLEEVGRVNQRGLVVKKACRSSYRIPAVLPPRKLLLVGLGLGGVDARRSHVFRE